MGYVILLWHSLSLPYNYFGEDFEENEQVICNPLLVQTESIQDVVISESKQKMM